MKALQRGDLESARVIFEKVVRVAPSSPEAHNSLGWTLLSEGRTAQAIAQFHSALKIKPAFAQAHLNLANALAQLRKRHYPLVLQHPEKIRRALEQSATQGRSAAEGYWILLLELLQWQHEHEVFENRAIEFAVAFEVSPPSWEPPPDAALVVAEAEESIARSAAPENADQLSWHGTLTGSSDPQLGKFIVFREGRHTIPIDMTAVDRIDFVCAGALSNAIVRAESQRKGVQIIGASPIIRALLLLIGISPRHFVKKSQ